MDDTPHHLANGNAKPPPRLATVDDIVTRLRSYATDDKIMCDDVLIHDAADEIEHLRKENQTLHINLMIAHSENAGLYQHP